MTRTATVISLLVLSLALSGCTNARFEYAERWYRLRPPPTKEQVARFQEQFPTTPVMTTQPGTWDKLEPGMTRAMVRALVGDRLKKGRSAAKLVQDSKPIVDEWHVRLYFR